MVKIAVIQAIPVIEVLTIFDLICILQLFCYNYWNPFKTMENPPIVDRIIFSKAIFFSNSFKMCLNLILNTILKRKSKILKN